MRPNLAHLVERGYRAVPYTAEPGKALLASGTLIALCVFLTWPAPVAAEPSANDLLIQGQWLEREDDLEGALETYDALLSGFQDATEARDARFRRGLTLAHLGRHPEAFPDFRLLRRRAGEGLERAILDIQLGSCHQALGRSRRATALVVPALESIEALEDDGSLAWYRAQAHVVLGSVLGEGMDRISMDVASERVQRRRLARRVDLFDRAAAHYQVAIEHQQPLWACAAGFQLGWLHERQRAALLGTPAPRHLTDEQAAIYGEALEEVTAGHLTGAADIYRQLLTYAASVGVHNDWIDRARDRLEALGP